MMSAIDMSRLRDDPTDAPESYFIGGQPQLHRACRRLAGADLSSASIDDVRTIRQAVSRPESPAIAEVCEVDGVVAQLVRLLDMDCDPLEPASSNMQFQAAWCLTNIASGESAFTRKIVHHGAVPIFVRLLSSANDDVREQVAWAVGNIAGDGAWLRDELLRAGALAPLVNACALEHAMANSSTVRCKLSMLRQATWALSNLCRGSPRPNLDAVRPALPTLRRLLDNKDTETLADACWCLSYLSEGEDERIKEVADAGVCGRLAQLLAHANERVVTPALRTVGNIVSGGEAETQAAVDAGVLPALKALVAAGGKNCKEACWAASNITAGTSQQIQAALDAGLLTPLLSVLRSADASLAARQEAAHAVANVTSGGTSVQKRSLLDHGAVKAICGLLRSAGSEASASAAQAQTEALANLLALADADSTDSEGNSRGSDAARTVAESGLLSMWRRTELTTDLQMMVRQGILTRAQAQDMMGSADLPSDAAQRVSALVERHRGAVAVVAPVAAMATETDVARVEETAPCAAIPPPPPPPAAFVLPAVSCSV